ncbi:4-hydroxyphenylpyruvate dioxygenase [Acinetobacter radioresistens]|jgi:4-hydroxyphenylpyruvate dioxygenase|uniref:4-hydroxyphenylpyruvate dioxygenase n=2 Tax=Acinetobacter radioresistens TaxID=40216 RepID=A0A2T1IYL2_ACIRA|nr:MULTISPECIES: 4-hydroxyphenylpyruvate dioxygenase [Acinetobacter]AWV86253.1 4-hydroxyphenylpyruvate dioxygenase [Acinetobacter radioresistens]EET83073.1 4-hydroxyphenylpyruvate dioxygenase [Acinetobacter radioresistens SK82]EEY87376.1 4-hydroxyphenylpyruvate dioxygenase [Acinetobacter radioresistens SH164]EJO37239.1 4-hydroxyphenylpyruvate dioxygenase [Acinetobacter radioresistens WC-A-157]ENV87749.1 4-hydroxyphenylpyruvate dioxygenase [Acinetobacter radioresistens NIPH 2130]
MNVLENPLELCGFAFIEFVSKDGELDQVFQTIGFTKVARHKSKNVYLWRQGNINIILNYQPESYASYFFNEHGPSACAMGFKTKDAAKAYKKALELGAEPMLNKVGPMELNIPAIKGIGGMPIFLIDRDIYQSDFEFLEGVDANPVGTGLNEIDHLTHNVYKGRMEYWANFYEKIFNFQEIRYFDIKGEYTGLTSKALTAPDGMIRIPLNEDSDKGNGQIAEFLADFNGEGIQHIAFITDDLVSTWDKLHDLGAKFMTAPPETYYEMLPERLPNHGEPTEELKKRGILLDGNTKDGEKRLLLQIFSENMIGPVFFEFIQRKDDDGFGEGNFKALFESIERDQIKRGVLSVTD